MAWVRSAVLSLGILILTVLSNGLVLLNVSSFYHDIARGAVIIPRRVSGHPPQAKPPAAVARTSDMTPLLSLEDIHKHFPGVYALKGVDFAVQTGRGSTRWSAKMARAKAP